MRVGSVKRKAKSVGRRAWGVRCRAKGVGRRAYGVRRIGYGVWMLFCVPCLLVGAGEIKIGESVVETLKFDGDEYVSLKELVSVYAGSMQCDETTQKVTVGVSDHTIVFTPENNTVIVDDAPKHFPLPSRWRDDGLYIPIYFIDDIFPTASPASKPVAGQIESVTCTVKADTFVTTVKVNPRVHFETRTLSPKKCQLVVNGRTKDGKPKSIPRGIVTKIEFKTGTTTTITFYLKEEGDMRVTTSETGLVVKIFGRPKRWVKRIVVDPGHGGKDSGAVGKNGLKEKDCNLDIARRLKTKLEKELGVTVLLTRDRDVFIPLNGRTEFANTRNAQLFISIHNNAAPSFAQTRGFETYFLSEARTTWARAVEQRENASIRFELPDTNLAHLNAASLILTDMAQNEFLRESSRMAELVQETAAPFAGIPNRGLNQAGFFVLRGAFMPAILVEGAFVSNYNEERLLRSPEFRERMAEGICRGVKKFVYEYEQTITAQ